MAISEIYNMFYELCVQVPVHELERNLDAAKELGWDGLCFIADRKDMKELKAAIRQARGIGVSAGLLLQPRNNNELKRQVSAARRSHEFIAVRPQSTEISRAALETRGVDVLLGWESAGETGRRSMDYVMVKLAAGNGVSIAFSLQPLLAAYNRARAGVMSKYIETVRFVRKYGTPFILTSGALSSWDLRSPSELAAFGKVLGFHGKEIKQALSGSMLNENINRLSGRWVMPGVEVE